MTETVATTPVGTLPARRTKAKAAPIPMIDRYKLIEKVGIYAGLFVFLFFVLAPFIEGFRVSLRPLDHLLEHPRVGRPAVDLEADAGQLTHQDDLFTKEREGTPGRILPN